MYRVMLGERQQMFAGKKAYWSDKAVADRIAYQLNCDFPDRKYVVEPCPAPSGDATMYVLM